MNTILSNLNCIIDVQLDASLLTAFEKQVQVLIVLLSGVMFVDCHQVYY